MFASRSDNLDAPDTNQAADVFMRTGANTILISRPDAGVESVGASTAPSIARLVGNNTRLTAFQTAADNMGAEDDDDFTQVYARRTGIVLGSTPLYVSRPSGTAAYRSGVNSSHLRPQQRSSENAVALNGDGRYAVFLSDADELSSDDDDRFTNVFRRDNLTGETTLVSRAGGAAGAAANATSAVAGGGLVPGTGAPTGSPAISADGNRIAFTTAATNLAGDDANGLPDVFVRDVAAATTVLASRQPNGAPVPLASGDPALSGDGNRVAFSTSSSMDAQDTGNADVYLRDLAAGTTVLVSRRGANGPAGDDDSSAPALDADGSHVAFHSSATDLDPPFTDANLDVDVFVRDVAAGQVRLVSRAAAGMAAANDGSSVPAISRRRQPDRVRERRDQPRRRLRRQRRRARRVPARHGRGDHDARQPHRRGRRHLRQRAVRARDDRRGGHPGRVRDAGERPRAGRRQRARRRPGARHGRRHHRAREPRRRAGATGSAARRACPATATASSSRRSPTTSRRTRPAPTSSAWPGARCAATARSARSP